MDDGILMGPVGDAKGKSPVELHTTHDLIENVVIG
jgi:hypothetical protein